MKQSPKREELGVKRQASLTSWFSSGDPWIWLNAGAVSLSLLMVVGLVALIMARGAGPFLASEHRGL